MRKPTERTSIITIDPTTSNSGGWGETARTFSTVRTRRAFLFFLGLIYLTAFLSLWPQAPGLWGERGILTAASDTTLLTACGLGIIFSLLVIFDVAPAVSLAASWLLYLYFVTIGGDFMSFQWDVLLLETGFLAVFLAPFRLKPWPAIEEETSIPILWLLRLLLFKLMFLSGFMKLAGGDVCWRNLSALRFYYETQPLPPWTAWYAHQWPAWFQSLSCAVMLFIELGVPFLIFCGRRARITACAFFIFLQALILLMGNYGIFNWLTIALSLLLLDDGVLRFRGAAPQAKKGKSWWVTGPVVFLIAFLSVSQIFFGLSFPWAERLHLVNRYGLFAVMTTERPEILLEGSDDGVEWKPYEFHFKPGELSRSPGFLAPYHPRLDWQMWFAALSRPEHNPWFLNFCERILEGSPEVLGLLKSNPFKDRPPRYLRAVLCQYRFVGPAERKKGAWWICDRKGLYMPVLKNT